MKKNEPEPLSYTTHKNKLKMDERPKCETENHQNARRKQDLGHSNFLLYTSPKAREIKAKLNYWDLIKIKKQLMKLKDNRQNGRRYLQMTYQIKG